MKLAIASASALIGIASVSTAQNVTYFPQVGPNYRHASTLQQGLLDGRARMLAAEGIRNYYLALAERERQQALLLRQQRASELRERARRRRGTVTSGEESAAQSHAETTLERRARKQRANERMRLAARQIRTGTGQIAWPEVFWHPQFDHARYRVESAFDPGQFHLRGNGTLACAQTMDCIRDIQGLLAARLRAGEHDYQVHATARRFLQGLQYAALHPGSASGPVGE